MFNKKVKSAIIDGAGTVIGSAIMAFGISSFLLPNQLSSGGFAGIATITYYLLGIPMGIMNFILNVPLFVFAGYKIGKEFFVKSIVGTISLSIFIDIFDKYPAITTDRLLACIYGGVIIGIGTAIILKVGSSTGGTELIANIIKAYNPNILISRYLTMIDIAVIALNVIVFRKVEIGLYSAIAIYLYGQLIDIIYEGVYLQYKPLSNLINIDEIEKVELKYYDDSLNESIISLNNEKKELFIVSLKKIEYQNTFSLNNLSSKETIIVTYKDDSTISLMHYFVTSSNKNEEKNIKIKTEDYVKLIGVFYE